MVIGQKNLAGRNQSTRQSRQPPAQGVAKPTSTHVWRGPSPQNTSWGRLPTYLKFRATNLISFQTGNLWLTGRYLFLGMASASSKWKHNRLWPPATWTAQLLTWVRKLWPAQLRHKLQLFSIVITCFNLWVPHHPGYFELQKKCHGFALFFFSLPAQTQVGSLSQTTQSPCLPARTVWYTLSQLHLRSHSWPGDQPKTFPFSFFCTMWSKDPVPSNLFPSGV